MEYQVLKWDFGTLGIDCEINGMFKSEFLVGVWFGSYEECSKNGECLTSIRGTTTRRPRGNDLVRRIGKRPILSWLCINIWNSNYQSGWW
jgi:hypothetical protein